MNYKQANIQYYNHNKDLFGEGDPRILWKQEELQIERFERQLSLFDYNNKVILDVGCGYGDFYLYLLRKKIKPKLYVGVDLVHSHCKLAKERLPKNSIIIEGDFLESSLPNVDIAVSSGALNVYFDSWKETALLFLDKMWLLSREAIAFNLRSSYGLTGNYETKSKQIEDMDPSFWCKYAHEKTNKYGLYHDYVKYDYTIAMWKTKDTLKSSL